MIGRTYTRKVVVDAVPAVRIRNDNVVSKPLHKLLSRSALVEASLAALADDRVGDDGHVQRAGELEVEVVVVADL